MNEIIKVFLVLNFVFSSFIFAMERGDVVQKDYESQVAAFLSELSLVVKDQAAQQKFIEYYRNMLMYFQEGNSSQFIVYMTSEAKKLNEFIRQPEIVTTIDFRALNNILQDGRWSKLFVNLVDFSHNKTKISRERSLYFYRAVVMPFFLGCVILAVILFVPGAHADECHVQQDDTINQILQAARCISHKAINGCSCLDFLYCSSRSEYLNFEQKIQCMLNLCKCIFHYWIDNCPCLVIDR